MPNLFRRAALGATILIALWACGSATSPPPLTPAQIARHIDSVLSRTSVSSPKYVALEVAEFGPAYGVAPSEIVITIRSGRPQKWQGFVVRSTAASFGVDSSTDIIAYSDYALTNVLWAQIIHGSAGRSSAAFVELATNDSLYESEASGSANIALMSMGSACTLTPGLVNITAPPEASCVLATYAGGLSWSIPGASPEFQTISIATQSFTGLRER